MIDLTKIEKPFGLLDDETQAALMEHAKSGERIELFVGTHWIVANPTWLETATYRAKPQPARKTVYPWDALDDRIKWAAVDKDGFLLLSGDKPFLKLGSAHWSTTDWSSDRLTGTLKFQRGDEHWTETLQCRPGYEGDE